MHQKAHAKKMLVINFKKSLSGELKKLVKIIICKLMVMRLLLKYNQLQNTMHRALLLD